MPPSTPGNSAAPPRGVVLTRVFDAPRPVVFDAWTDSKQMSQWFGPRGYTSVCEVDAKPGGAIRVEMRAPDGTVHSSRGVFEDVRKPERLVFTMGVAGADGALLFEVLNTVTFEEHAGKTKVTVDARVLKSSPGAEQFLRGMEEGWKQTLDRLGEHVERKVAGAARR